MPIPLLLVTTSIIFGIKYSHQGIKGIVGNTFGGVIFGSLFLVAGSLIPGMILRFLSNLSLAFPLSKNPSYSFPEVQEQNIVERSEVIELVGMVIS